MHGWIILDKPLGLGSTQAVSAVKRILLCSGKIYFDLITAREAKKRDDVAIVRFEQLYPLSDALLAETVKEGYTVQSTFPSHEHEHFIAHYRGLLELWAKDEEKALAQ